MGLRDMFQRIFGHSGAAASEESENSSSVGEPGSADSWNRVQKAYGDGTNVSGIIVSREDGGFVADLDGIHAFLPDNLADVKPLSNPQDLVGRKLELRVMKLDHERKRAVVSRRDVLMNTSRADTERLLQSLEEGQTVRGTVRTITDFGAFVDLGGVDGLIHLQDLSWKKISHPSEAVSVGDVVEARVLKVDRARARVSLGIKQLSADPWTELSGRFSVGDTVIGKVLSVKDYGFFVDIGNGLAGMVPASEMTWSNRKTNPSKVVKEGDTVKAQVLAIDGKKRRITLGLRQLTPDPMTAFAMCCPVGTRITGRVVNISDYGFFVEVEDGLDGLVHATEIDWTQKNPVPSEVVRIGDTVKVQVIGIDEEKRRIELSMKQCLPNPWDEYAAAHSAGDRVRGTVNTIAKFGIFVGLAPGVDGLVHLSEMPSAEPGEEAIKKYKEGDEVEAVIMDINPDLKRIALSIRLLEEEQSGS